MDARIEREKPSTSKVGRAVLSIYLNVDQSSPVNRNRGFETALSAKLKTIEQNLERASEEEFAASTSAVRSFLANYEPTGKGIVIFANVTGVLNTVKVSIDLETDARWVWCHTWNPTLRPSTISNDVSSWSPTPGIPGCSAFF